MVQSSWSYYCQYFLRAQLAITVCKFTQVSCKAKTEIFPRKTPQGQISLIKYGVRQRSFL